MHEKCVPHVQKTADSDVTPGRQTHPRTEVAASARQYHRSTTITHATNQNLWSRRTVTRPKSFSTRRPLESVTIQV